MAGFGFTTLRSVSRFARVGFRVSLRQSLRSFLAMTMLIHALVLMNPPPVFSQEAAMKMVGNAHVEDCYRVVRNTQLARQALASEPVAGPTPFARGHTLL